jgi:hypothetical protein
MTTRQHVARRHFETRQVHAGAAVPDPDPTTLLTELLPRRVESHTLRQ